jgi:hypothetical protein
MTQRTAASGRNADTGMPHAGGVIQSNKRGNVAWLPESSRQYLFVMSIGLSQMRDESAEQRISQIDCKHGGE